MKTTVLAADTSAFAPGQRITIDGRVVVIESVHRGAVIVGRPRLRDWIAVAWMRAVDLFRNVAQWGAP